jgi:benzoate-CoA ligase family protein
VFGAAGATAPSRGGTVPEPFNAAAWLVDRHVADGRGDHVAVICGEQRLTYAELQAEVLRAASGFAALGLRAEERVLMVADDETGFLAAFLGAMRMGAVPVPVSTMLRSDDLAGLAVDARARLVVTSEAHAGHLATIVAAAADTLLGAVLIGGAALPAPLAPSELPVRRLGEGGSADPVDPAGTWDESPGFWLYTSGTTGVPKGAMHRHVDLRATYETYARHVLEVGPDDRCFSVAKLFFAYGLGNSCTFPLAAGATTVLSPAPPTPAGVVQLLRRDRPTLFFASPGFVAALLDAGATAEDLASVRLAVTAGESLPGELHRRATERFAVPFLDGIGTTEALHIFCSNRPGAERPGTSGTLVPGYEAELVDDHGRPIIEPDTPGYLRIRGESVATGYWCRSEATRAAFQGDWLRTGDVYVRTADDYWKFLGRNNDMIKAGGIWVSPAEVENALLQHPSVLEAAVVGARDDAGLETVVAFCVGRSGAAIDPDELLAHCRSVMAAFKRPRRVVVVDELPKTATGKVQRYALRRRLDPAGQQANSA